MRLAAFIVAALLLAAPARADESDEPRELYKKATAHFNLGRFNEAAAEYERLFENHPDPALLYNIAQCYRLAGGTEEKALFFYKSYLQRSPKAKNRPEVEERIVGLEKIVDAQKKTQQTPPNTTIEKPEPTEKHAPEAATQVDHPTPVYKRWWLWTIVGVAAAGLAVGLGVGLTASPPKFNPNLQEGGPGSTHSALLTF